MEHIVQFGISIDDEVIASRIEKNAEKVITDKLFKEAENELFDKRYGGLSRFSEMKFDSFLESNHDKIIDSAGKYLEKLSRTKKAKEILNKIKEKKTERNDPNEASADKL